MSLFSIGIANTEFYMYLIIWTILGHFIRMAMQLVYL